MLVQAARDDAFEHLRLAAREPRQHGFAVGGLGVLGEGGAGLLQQAFDQGQQLLFGKGLLHEVQRAFFHGVHGQGDVGVAGDDGHGQGRVAFGQFVLQFQAAHAVHAHVSQQAGYFSGVVTFEKGFG